MTKPTTPAAPITFALLLLATAGCDFLGGDLPMNHTVNNRELPSRIHSLYLQTTGNSKYSARFRTYLVYELEDMGIKLSDSESTADIVLNIDFATATRPSHLSQAILHAEFSVEGKTSPMTVCKSTSSGQEADFGSGSESEVATAFKKNYPSVRSVNISPKSNFQASPPFSAKLARELKDLGISVVDSGKSDATIRVSLDRSEVAITEDILEYRSHTFANHSSFDSRSRSELVLSTRLTANQQTECISQATDLDWVSGNATLPAEARRIAKYLAKDKSLSGGTALNP